MKQIFKKLSMAMLFLVFLPIPGLAAVQMADMFGVDNAKGDPNTFVLVPVNITNVTNGPIQTIKFDVLYDNSIISLNSSDPMSVQVSTLTPGWISALGVNNQSITLTTLIKANAISNGATGTVVLLNFSVRNMPGASSMINMSKIDFSNTVNVKGWAPPKNGTFTVTGPSIKINVTGIPVINQSTSNILKVEYTNFSSNDRYNVSITASNGTQVYYEQGWLMGNFIEIKSINWIPKETGNHTVLAYGNFTAGSKNMSVFDSAVIAPVPEVTTIILVSAGMLVLIGIRRYKKE